MAQESSRTAALSDGLLRSLVGRVSTDRASLTSAALPDAAAAQRDDGAGFALLLAPGERAFGAAMLWARRIHATELTLFAADDADPGGHARRAAAFTAPPTVLRFTRADIEAARPVELATPQALGRDLASIASEIEARGLDVMVDHGVAVVEFRGLEVAQLTIDDGEPVAVVGVGAVDREATRVLHPSTPFWESLDRVVAQVGASRRAGAVGGALGLMARERWLDRHLRDDPSAFGAVSAEALMPTAPRLGMRTEGPAASLHRGPDGETVVVSTVGADVGLIGAVADLIVRERPRSVVVATVDGHRLDLLHDLDGFVTAPASLRTFRAPWTAPDDL